MKLRYLFAIGLICTLAACGDDDSPTAPSGPVVPFSTTDLRVGAGAAAVTGSRLTMHYTGWLYSATAPDNKGQQFQTSVGGNPLSFTLGANQVISGLDQGLTGMRVGGLRRIVIPSELAYGASGNGPIPPNTALVFEIELVGVQ